MTRPISRWRARGASRTGGTNGPKVHLSTGFGPFGPLVPPVLRGCGVRDRTDRAAPARRRPVVMLVQLWERRSRARSRQPPDRGGWPALRGRAVGSFSRCPVLVAHQMSASGLG